jgi:hypothetical protein
MIVVTIGLAYMGLEPYVRRRWPVMLISWSRLLAGSWRDPLVGRDVLFGLIIGVIIVIMSLIPQLLGFSPLPSSIPLGTNTLLRILNGDWLATSSLIILPTHSVAVAMMLLFLLFLMRLLTRRDWLAVILFTLICVALYVPDHWQFVVAWFLVFGLLGVAMMRYGLVMLASAMLLSYGLQNFPVTLDFSVWYAGTGLAPLVLLLALAVFAFYTSLGGQKVFKGSLLEE